MVFLLDFSQIRNGKDKIPDPWGRIGNTGLTPSSYSHSFMLHTYTAISAKLV